MLLAVARDVAAFAEGALEAIKEAIVEYQDPDLIWRHLGLRRALVGLTITTVTSFRSSLATEKQ